MLLGPLFFRRVVARRPTTYDSPNQKITPASQPPCLAFLQALWHGSLLAWLSASKLQQVPVLTAAGAAPTAAGVTAAPMAAPLFTWQCSSSSSHATGNDLHPQGPDQGQHPAGSLSGCELVQLLASCTSLASAHDRCCAASFWAGYLGCVKTHMTLWSAGAAAPLGLSKGQMKTPTHTKQKPLLNLTAASAFVCILCTKWLQASGSCGIARRRSNVCIGLCWAGLQRPRCLNTPA